MGIDAHVWEPWVPFCAPVRLGPVPFGYSVKDKKLLVNEVEAQIVREAFTLFLQHRQMAMVARTLTERGLLPRGSSRPPEEGLRWSKDAIARVLRNPLYAGFMMYGDELHPGEHPRLIDESTFRHAERILAGTGRELRIGGTNPDYVLRGLLRCGLCREAMCPGSTTKNGKVYKKRAPLLNALGSSLPAGQKRERERRPEPPRRALLHARGALCANAVHVRVVLAERRRSRKRGGETQRRRRSLSEAAVKKCGVAFPRPRLNGSNRDYLTPWRSDPVFNSANP